MGGGFIVLEEAAYIKADTIKLIVMPVLRLVECAIMMISTLGKSSNVFNRMVESNALYTHRVKFVCDECEKLDVFETCPHKSYCRPHWFDENDDMQKALFPDDEDLRRENLGTAESGSRNCFPAPLVNALKVRPRPTSIQLDMPPTYIYISIDPCGGSNDPERSSSDFAIVSGCRMADGFMYLGAERLTVIDTSNYESVLTDHIMNLRKVPGLGGAKLVVDVEGNGGSVEARIIQLIALKFKDVVVVNDFKGKFGTNTTNPMKQNATIMFRNALEQRGLCFFGNFVTSDRHPQGLLEAIFKQMLDFEKVIRPSTHPDRAATFSYSGKGSSGKNKDDLIMTMLRTLFLQHRFQNEEKFRIDRM